MSHKSKTAEEYQWQKPQTNTKQTYLDGTQPSLKLRDLLDEVVLFLLGLALELFLFTPELCIFLRNGIEKRGHIVAGNSNEGVLRHTGEAGGDTVEAATTSAGSSTDGALAVGGLLRPERSVPAAVVYLDQYFVRKELGNNLRPASVPAHRAPRTTQQARCTKPCPNAALALLWHRPGTALALPWYCTALASTTLALQCSQHYPCYYCFGAALALS